MSFSVCLRLSLAQTFLRPVSVSAPAPAPAIPALQHLTRTFTTQTFQFKKSPPLPPRPTLAESTTLKKSLKGSGPGGQKINKTSSAVQLTHLPTGIVVKSQRTRSRTQNEKIARRILAEKVEVLEKGAEARVVRKRELVSRRKRSGEKKRRRKYRDLEAGRNGAGGDEEKEEEEAGEDRDQDEDGQGEGKSEGKVESNVKLKSELDEAVTSGRPQIYQDQLSRLITEQTR